MDEERRPKGRKNEYFRIAEAAEYLGKSNRTIQRYIKSGLLPSRKFRKYGKSLWIKKTDVEEIEKFIQRKTKPGDLYEFFTIADLKIESLERKVAFLMYVNGVEVSSLQGKDIEVLVKIYEETNKYLNEGLFNIGLEQLKKWAWVFCQFTEIEFKRVSEHTGDKDPWMPFHQLCTGFMSNLTATFDLHNNTSAKSVYRLLEKGRRMLSEATIIYTHEYTSRKNIEELYPIVEFGVDNDTLSRFVHAELTLQSE